MLNEVFGTLINYRKNPKRLEDSGYALLTSANDFLRVRERGEGF